MISPFFFFVLVCVLAHVRGCLCAVSNRTIDDTNGDEITGFLPIYEPRDSWNTDGACPKCAVHPDPSLAFDHTWHDGTTNQNPPYSVEIHFTGTAVYLFCIVTPNNIGGTIANTNLTFTLDDTLLPDGYTHMSDSSSPISYNVSVFAAEGLKNVSHKLIARTGSPSLFLFDYAIYT
ncbi:hypothetical protein FB451DRAFT_1039118 [Mycena latifolia]|nr:hypothetical protein FB451DRAFT_1039118 [Mycena latifolia]